MAIMLERATTQSRPYLKRAPPSRSVAQFPGSMYPTETSRAGPAKARYCRQKLAECAGTATVECMSSSERCPTAPAGVAGAAYSRPGTDSRDEESMAKIARLPSHGNADEEGDVVVVVADSQVHAGVELHVGRHRVQDAGVELRDVALVEIDARDAD